LGALEKDLKEILLDEEKILNKTRELGKQITEDYQGKELIVVGILKGAIVFLADLVRNIDLPLKLDFISTSSYGDSMESSGAVRFLKDLETSVEGKHVLIVEDIVDTGLTLQYLLTNLSSRGAISVKVCSLLDKPERRTVDVTPDYNGFTIPDAFVVGYGLDYAEHYRNLPYIAILDPKIYS